MDNLRGIEDNSIHLERTARQFETTREKSISPNDPLRYSRAIRETRSTTAINSIRAVKAIGTIRAIKAFKIIRAIGSIS